MVSDSVLVVVDGMAIELEIKLELTDSKLEDRSSDLWNETEVMRVSDGLDVLSESAGTTIEDFVVLKTVEEVVTGMAVVV